MKPRGQIVVSIIVDPAKRREIILPAKLHVGHDRSGRVCWIGGQHSQGLPQRHRGLVGHPGQLPALTIPTTGNPGRAAMSTPSRASRSALVLSSGRLRALWQGQSQREKT